MTGERRARAAGRHTTERPQQDTVPSVFPGFAEVDADVHRVVANLSEYRRSRSLSQTEIAARMGTSQSAVARLEAGHGDARLSTLQRYSRALGYTMCFAVTPLDDDEARS